MKKDTEEIWNGSNCY